MIYLTLFSLVMLLAVVFERNLFLTSVIAYLGWVIIFGWSFMSYLDKRYTNKDINKYENLFNRK